MNAFTHVYLSMVFKKAIEKKLPVKLHTLSFVRGNLKPDFSLLLIKVPHYKIPTSELVIREMDKLITHQANKFAACTNDFSERLGVVTHYLSDFFCYAHSTGFKGSVIDHYIYEKKLSRYRRAMKDKITDMIGSVPFANCGTDYQSACRFLDRLHAKYRSKKPSYARDLVYTVKAGIPLAVYLVTVCLQLGEAQLAA